MQFILEFKSFYKKGDIVKIEYWYNDMVTPVIILEQTSPRKVKISHKISESKIFNAPDEEISISQIIDKHRV
jgi:hypothetical protein